PRPTPPSAQPSRATGLPSRDSFAPQPNRVVPGGRAQTPAVAIDPQEFRQGPSRREVHNDLELGKLRERAKLNTVLGEDGPRTRESALSQADLLLGGFHLHSKEKTDEGADITRDAEHVNSTKDTDPASTRHQMATEMVEANAALEQEALQSLSPTEQAQYLAVKEQLLAIQPEGDPVAALALQTLLLKGSLPGDEALGGGGTLLEQLNGLATQELGEGLDRGQLLSDVVQEVATPESIGQRNKGTCAATAVEIQLVKENPAEYVRLVSGLASPEGQVTLADGKTVIAREELGTDARGIIDDVRSESQELLAPALMEAANGGDLDYQDGTDTHYDGDGDKVHKGLTPSESDRLAEAVFGRKYDTMSGIDTSTEEAAAWDLIQERTAEGESVAVGIDWTGGGHKVVVTGTGVDEKTGEEYVEYTNPWGRTERMPKDEFLDRLNSVHTRAEEKEPPTLPPIFRRPTAFAG
ncbi:hypothetical protein, partial [Corallococcus llansteffanensis]